MVQVFDRYDRVIIGESSAGEVLSFIQNKEMDELLSQDEQTIVSWGQNGDGAVIWLNAVSFDETSNTAARKYAFLVDEDSPGWRLCYGSKSKKMRMDFKFIVPPEYDELEITTETQRRREALKTAVSLYLTDMNEVRYDSDYIYATAMMVRQTFNELLYELERVPAKLSEIDKPAGIEFSHPTLGPGRIRMLFDKESYIVTIKVKIGKYVDSFDDHEDVIAMGDPAAEQDRIDEAQSTMVVDEQKAKSNWLDRVTRGNKQRSEEELRKIEEMAEQKAQEGLMSLEAEQAAQGQEEENAPETGLPQDEGDQTSQEAPQAAASEDNAQPEGPAEPAETTETTVEEAPAAEQGGETQAP
jgi:hypothetical protein